MEFLTSKFFTYIEVIICIYLAQTLFKIASCRKDGSFSFKELLDGTINYVFYFIGIIVFFFGGMLVPNEHIIMLNGKNYSITDLLTLFAYTLMSLQAYKCFKNIKETFNVTDEDLKDINDKNANLRIENNG